MYEISDRGPKNSLSSKDRDESRLILLFPVIITVHLEQTWAKWNLTWLVNSGFLPWPLPHSREQQQHGERRHQHPTLPVAASSGPVLCSKEPTWECLSSSACSKNTRGSNKISPWYFQTASLLSNTIFISNPSQICQSMNLTGNIIHWPSLSSWFYGSAGEI